MAAVHFQVVLMLMLWKLVGAFLAPLARLRRAEVSRLLPVAWLKLVVAWMRLSTKNLRVLATLRFASRANWQIVGSLLRLICHHIVFARNRACFHLQHYVPWRPCAVTWLTSPAVRLPHR